MKKNSCKLSDDLYLEPHSGTLKERAGMARDVEKKLLADAGSLEEFASGHEYFGLHYRNRKWVFREWAPNADSITMVGSFSDWERRDEFSLERINDAGVWEITLSSSSIKHLDTYRLFMTWPGGEGERIPSYARRVVQDEKTMGFDAQVWKPPRKYKWKNKSPRLDTVPLIYETHVGMAQEEEKIGTYDEFRKNILPRIVEAGYNTVQFMAIMQHPYYGSFGYHVSSFFASSSLFGTPDELKKLIDEAHGMGLSVIMDLVHSHAVKNENEGLSRFDGTLYQYFHDGGRGMHDAWDSRCFDYGKPEVLHFLLSNCRYWLDEFKVDGFRFDGITSMLYRHHGLGASFTSYDDYFNDMVDLEAVTYLTLANKLIHTIRPDAITIAEDVSGMPGLASPVEEKGCGFDYRLAMGVPDCWFKLVNDTKDEDWSMDFLWHELTNRRPEESTISYVESHDQALVGGKTMIFELIDHHMYDGMSKNDQNIHIDRGMAIHKMARLITLGSASFGYLTFFGNEFGHPEWIDFPREGNDWSLKYARRQWSLRDSPFLRYHYLADFDRAILSLEDEYSFVGSDPSYVTRHNDDKVIAFERGGLMMVFNFHPFNSYSDYRIECPAGEYELVLDSDAPEYGGHSRIEAGQHYFSQTAPEKSGLPDYIQVYIPCRTAMVLRKIS